MMINSSFADRTAGHRTAGKKNFTRYSKVDRAMQAELDYIAVKVHHATNEEFRMRNLIAPSEEDDELEAYYDMHTSSDLL